MGAPSQPELRSTHQQVGRNDPCPCGSGRKFKQCCGAARPLGTSVAAAPAVPLARAPLTAAGREARTYLPPDRTLPLPAGPPGSPPHRTKGSEPTREVRERLQLGAQLIKQGRHGAAIGILSEAVRLVPENAAAHHDLGLARLESHHVPEAIASFQRAIALNPDFARAYYHLAIALDRLGQTREAARAYERTTELDPKNPDAQSRLAELLTRMGADRPRVADRFRRAADVAPRTPQGRLNRARALLSEENFDAAERELRRLTALSPQLSLAHYHLGTIFASSGRFEAAVDSFERAARTDPTNYTAYLSRVLAKKVTEADRPLVTRLLAQLETCGPYDGPRMILHFALGKAYDDLKDYGTAIHHFDIANELRSHASAFSASDFAKRIDRLISTCTPDFLARHAGVATPDATPVLIIGMPRSGTTLVEQIISNHPQAAGAGELMFWVDQALSLEPGLAACIPAERAGAMTSRYLEVLRGISPTALRVTDKMPSNFLWAGVIHALFPNARIIHCRRNPIDTCLSIYSLYFAAQMDFASRKEDLVFVYRQYERLMEHWRRVMTPERLFEVQYETLTADPEPLTRQLIAFCGLEWDDACLRPQDNARVVQTASLWQARQPIYRSSIERWRRYEPWLGALRELMPDIAASA